MVAAAWNKITTIPATKERKAAIAHDSDLQDLLMMVLDKPQVTDEGREVLPAGERFYIDHDRIQLARLLRYGYLFNPASLAKSLGFEGSLR